MPNSFGTNPGFSLNPNPQSGSGVFGQVPGQLGVPPVAAQLGQELPGLPNLNAAASQDIASNLSGTLSPGTQNALQNASATYGVTSGMPGSGLTWDSLYGNIAGASTAEQQLGLQEYNQTVPTVSGTQTVSPQLQEQVAMQNAIDAAAPNPTDAGIANIAFTVGNQLLGGGGYNTGNAAAADAGASGDTGGGSGGGGCC
jgi:hypothetical protein